MTKESVFYNCFISQEKPLENYRQCVGIFLLNEQNSLWLGQRVDSSNNQDSWQMPQGGVDLDEELGQAAIRELYEETGIRNPEILYESIYWYSYLFPKDISIPGYIGQTQKWFIMRVKNDAEVCLVPKDTQHKQEFIHYRWVPQKELKERDWLEKIIWFKRDLYKSLLQELTLHIPCN